MIRLLLLIIFLTPNIALASKQMQEKNYFASLRSSKTNVRSGPGLGYPIKFTFFQRGLPIHVVSEYDNWSEIRDFEGSSGWITNSLITKRRTLLIQTKAEFINMHKKPNEKSTIIYRLENNVIGSYIKCLEEEDWCALEVENKKGWVRKNYLFGI